MIVDNMKETINKCNIFVVISLIVIYISPVEVNQYPDDIATPTTCDKFSRYARFNPYSVLDEKWMVFYYWGPFMSHTRIEFKYPDEKDRKFINETFDGKVTVPVNWTARTVVMRSVLMRMDYLLVERGERGQFWMYELVQNPREKLTPLDARLKQVQNNKYLGLMVCESNIVWVMSKLSHIPLASAIPDAAASIGFVGRGGKSYLYQGHHWMPIPEMTEDEYWGTPEFHEEILSNKLNETKIQ